MSRFFFCVHGAVGTGRRTDKVAAAVFDPCQSTRFFPSLFAGVWDFLFALPNFMLRHWSAPYRWEGWVGRLDAGEMLSAWVGR